MPVNVEEFLRGVSMLADNHNCRVTVKQSCKGALVCGGMAFLGGVVAGPLGLAVGGSLGGLTAYKISNDFRSVGDIIRNDLTVRQKQELYDHILNTVRSMHPTDVMMLLPLITSSASIQEAVMKTVVTFVTNELGHSVNNRIS